MVVQIDSNHPSCWPQPEDFTTNRTSILCLFVQLPTDLFKLFMFFFWYFDTQLVS